MNILVVIKDGFRTCASSRLLENAPFTLRPFGKLRANGACIEFIPVYPFVVSLSNHKKTFSTTC